MADALRLAAQAELASRAPSGLTAALALVAASLDRYPTFEGDAAARRLLGIAATPVSRLAHDGPVNAAVFSPDGRWVATASDDRTARIHWLRASDLVSELTVRMPRQLTDDEWTRFGGRRLAFSPAEDSGGSDLGSGSVLLDSSEDTAQGGVTGNE